MNSAELSQILKKHQGWLDRRAGARADLAMQDLSGLRLPGVRLSKATLTGTNLSACVLTAAEFRDADLFGANLQKSDLENADFSGADLRGVLLRGSNLSGARLVKVDLRDGALMYAGDDAGTVVNNVDYSGIELEQYPNGWNRSGSIRSDKIALLFNR